MASHYAPRKARFGLLKKIVLSILRFVLGLAVLLAALWGIFTLIADHQSFVESYYQIQSDKLTSNVRVVQLSDLHLREFGDHNSELIERITALKPDIIAITGDMNDKLVDDYSVVTDLCEELVKIAPVYYAPGNHEWPKIVFDHSPIREDLEAVGVHFLADKTETLEVNGNTIAIGGVAEAPASYERYASEYFESFEQLDAFKLLLVHYPEYFLEDGYFSDVQGRSGALRPRPRRDDPHSRHRRALHAGSRRSAQADRGSASDRRHLPRHQPRSGRRQGQASPASTIRRNWSSWTSTGSENVLSCSMAAKRPLVSQRYQGAFLFYFYFKILRT